MNCYCCISVLIGTAQLCVMGMTEQMASHTSCCTSTLCSSTTNRSNGVISFSKHRNLWTSKLPSVHQANTRNTSTTLCCCSYSCCTTACLWNRFLVLTYGVLFCTLRASSLATCFLGLSGWNSSTAVQVFVFLWPTPPTINWL